MQKIIYVNAQDQHNIEVLAQVLERAGVDIRRSNKGGISVSGMLSYLVAQELERWRNGAGDEYAE